jgi:hypothetical protein
VAAILSIAAGVIHISAAGDHTGLPVMFVGFMIVATLQVALGGLLLWRRPSKLLIAGALALMVSSLGMWMLSRTAGLPFLEDGHLEPIGFKDGVTKLFELGAMPALLLLLSSDLSAVSLPSPRLSTQTLGVLGAGVFALMVPAMLLDGGTQHSHDQAVAMGLHEHGEGKEHAGEHADAHADTGSEAEHAHAGKEHAGDGNSHGHGDSMEAADGHEHSGTELASTLGGHGHSGSGMHRDSHGGGAPTDGHSHNEDSGGNEESGDNQHSHPRPEGRQHTDDHSGGGHGDGGSGHGDGGHGDGGHDDGAGHGDEGESDGFGGKDEPISLTYEPASPAQNGEPARGSTITFRSESGPYEEGAHSGEFHHGSSAGCNPTPEQQAVADKLFADTNAELKQYENNPAEALADGFYQVVGPADRFVHMINFDRVFDPTILDPAGLESFMYAMTDRGLVPLGGMYIMPAELKDGKVVPTEPKKGPEVAGCLTRWHKHAGWVAGASTAGTNWEETPEMLHVWTYPGTDPWSHYTGPEISQFWGPWSGVPSVCRISPGGTNVCFP